MVGNSLFFKSLLNISIILLICSEVEYSARKSVYIGGSRFFRVIAYRVERILFQKFLLFFICAERRQNCNIYDINEENCVFLEQFLERGE